MGGGITSLLKSFFLLLLFLKWKFDSSVLKNFLTQKVTDSILLGWIKLCLLSVQFISDINREPFTVYSIL